MSKKYGILPVDGAYACYLRRRDVSGESWHGFPVCAWAWDTYYNGVETIFRIRPMIQFEGKIRDVFSISNQVIYVITSNNRSPRKLIAELTGKDFEDEEAIVIANEPGRPHIGVYLIGGEKENDNDRRFNPGNVKDRRPRPR